MATRKSVKRAKVEGNPSHVAVQLRRSPRKHIMHDDTPHTTISQSDTAEQPGSNPYDTPYEIPTFNYPRAKSNPYRTSEYDILKGKSLWDDLSPAEESALAEHARLIDLFEYWEHIQDMCPPISHWPEWTRATMLKKHKSHEERYALMHQLVGNGIDPYWTMNAIKIADYDKRTNWWVCGQYDNDAMRHLNIMVRDCKSQPGSTNHQRFWQTGKKKIVSLVKPHTVLSK